MTLKTSYKKLFWMEAKRHVSLTGIGIFGMLITLPFLFLQQIISFEPQYGVAFRDAVNEFLSYQNDRLYRVTCGNYALPIFLCFFAILNGFILFGHLFSVKKQDFYFGLPVNRRELFWVHYLQGIVNILVPYVFNLVIVMVMAYTNHCMSTAFAFMLMQSCIANILFYLAVYTFTVIACVTAGTLFHAVFELGMLLFYAPVVTFIINLFFDGKLEQTESWLYQIPLASPVSGFAKMFYRPADSIYYAIEKLEIVHYGLSYFTFLLALTGISICTSYILFQKRCTDRTGKPFVYQYVKYIVKALLVTVGSLAAATFVEGRFDVDDLMVTFLSGIAGFIISTFLIDAFLESTLKGCWKNRKSQGIYALITILITISLIVYRENLTYHGFENLKKPYSLSKAQMDGCVVLDVDINKNQEETEEERLYTNLYKKVYNQEALVQFAEDIKQNREGKVRIAENSMGKVCYWDMVYKNGRVKRYTPDETYGYGVSYPYFLALTGHFYDGYPDKSFYILTDKKDLTFEEFKEQMLDWEHEVDWKYECVWTTIQEKEGKAE